MENIKRICNPMMDLSKFTSNKKILSKVVAQATTFVTKLCPKKIASLWETATIWQLLLE